MLGDKLMKLIPRKRRTFWRGVSSSLDSRRQPGLALRATKGDEAQPVMSFNYALPFAYSADSCKSLFRLSNAIGARPLVGFILRRKKPVVAALGVSSASWLKPAAAAGLANRMPRMAKSKGEPKLAFGPRLSSRSSGTMCGVDCISRSSLTQRAVRKCRSAFDRGD